MKVIFIEDIPRVARAGETKEVADGYGRNFLLPRKLAVLANSQASAVVEAQLKKRARQQAQTEAEMIELAGKLNGLEVTLKAKAGAKEQLYGSITSADIADELNRSAGLMVDKRKIELVEPVRQLGSYDVTIRFTQDIAAVIKLKVLSEMATEEKKAEVAVEKKAEVKAEKEVETKAEEVKVKAGKKREKKSEAKAETKEEKKAKSKAETKAEVKAEKEVEVKEEKVKAGKKGEKKEKAKEGKKSKGKKAEKVEGAGEKETEPGE